MISNDMLFTKVTLARAVAVVEGTKGQLAVKHASCWVRVSRSSQSDAEIRTFITLDQKQAGIAHTQGFETTIRIVGLSR